METTELIERLYQHHEDYAQGHTQDFYEVCYDCRIAANTIGQLQGIIDDMLGDHYVDYLEIYFNRCRELEEKLEKINKILEE